MNVIDLINANVVKVEAEAKAVLAKQTASVTQAVENSIKKAAGAEVTHVEHLVNKDAGKVEAAVVAAVDPRTAPVVVPVANTIPAVA